VLALWLAVVISTLGARPPLPVDETRYLAVAWEMWRTGGLLVPHLNGVPYSDKPPLLFWLIVGAWHLVGVQEWAARLIQPVAALVVLALTAVLARELWPTRPAITRLAPVALFGMVLWPVYATLVLFDVLLTAWVLLGMLGVLRAWRRGGATGWVMVALAVGGGVLTKGPVMLLHLLPVALLAPWWGGRRGSGSRRAWYGALALAVVAGAVLALAWALPAARAGGEAYARAILFGQTAHRIASSFAHRRPVWWYLPLLPALLFPWIIWPPVWRGVRALGGVRPESGTRFCIAWLVPVVVGFSLISGKQIHYLLPLLPGAALLVARALDGAPERVRARDALPPAFIVLLIGVASLAAPALARTGRAPAPLADAPVMPGVFALTLAAALLVVRLDRVPLAAAALATASAGVIIALNLGVVQSLAPTYDATSIAARLRVLEQRGYTIAYVGDYAGQFHFAGRLERPFVELEPERVGPWLRAHPRGAVVRVERGRRTPQLPCVQYVRDYDRGRVVIAACPASRLLSRLQTLHELAHAQRRQIARAVLPHRRAIAPPVPQGRPAISPWPGRRFEVQHVLAHHGRTATRIHRLPGHGDRPGPLEHEQRPFGVRRPGGQP
jgi:4-amino-4-deoxy-L-arabinose transferase-like glycosyltransferase